MTDPKNEDCEALHRLATKLADDLFDTTDEALLKEVREDGGDPDATAAHGRALFEKAAAHVAKSRLTTAKAAVAAARSRSPKVIPLRPPDARALLARVLAQHPDVANKLTLAARKAAGEASDADVQDMLEDLSELGISFDETGDG